MTHKTPADLIVSLIDARARRDVDAAVACYEADATVVIEPGKIVTGITAIRSFTETAMNLPLVFGGRAIVEGRDAAIHFSTWTMVLPKDGGTVELSGSTTDLLRKQQDGSWLMAIDNAWGAAIVGPGKSAD